MNLFAKAAMALSFAYYTLVLGYAWIGQIIGAHNEIWDFFDFPPQPVGPPTWALLVGAGVAGLTLAALAVAYLGVLSTLNGGTAQDFRQLARNLTRVGWGLIGFWLGYNLLTGAIQYLITVDVADTEGFDFGWDPLDLDIIFAIMGIALLAISQTLERAWMAEEENRQFL